jgi:hypothetical protein
MRWALLLLVLVLSGCSRNTFEVEDSKSLVRSATLRLCGSETPLERSGASFKLSRSIRCEADGDIVLTYQNGAPQHCIVGYVTPNMPQDFRFRAEQASCQPISENGVPAAP